MGVEEERQLGGKILQRQSGPQGSLHVGDGIGEGEGQLLGRGAAGLAHVVTGNRDRVPGGHLGSAIGEDVRDQPHGGAGWKDVRAAGDVFLEDVVLNGAAQPGGIDTLLLGGGDIHGQQDGRRGIDGHAGRDLVQWYPLEEPLHVLQARDGNPHPADFARCQGIVGVVADLGGQIEGHREAGLPLFQQVVKAAVGLGRAGVPGILPHSPGPAAVHGRVSAAGEGVFAREAYPLQILLRTHLGEIHPLQRCA